MTKNELRWRLKDLPTADEVASLVDSGVITKEEARILLFSEIKRDESAKIQALEEEVQFLRKLVDKLSAKSFVNYPTIWDTYSEYSPRYPVWYKNYEPVISTYKSGTMETTFSSTHTGGLPTVLSLSSQTAPTVHASVRPLSSLNN